MNTPSNLFNLNTHIPAERKQLRDGATRRTPWARLGSAVNLPLSSPDVLAKAGLDWEPELRPVFTCDSNGNMRAVEGKNAVVRQDTEHALGIVGNAYTLASNRAIVEALSRISDAPDAIVEHAGCFDGGARVWMQARIPRLSFAIGSDEHDAYVVAENSHDGTQALSLGIYVLRLVCTNGMTVKHTLTRQSFRHTSNVNRRLRAASDQYADALAAFEQHQNELRQLAAVASSAASFEAIMRAAWEVKPSELADGTETQRARTIRRDRERELARIRQSATCNVTGTAGTLFSDLQAVTEYVDHVKGSGDDGASYAIGSSADAVKARAMDAALALV